jgi:hypothetical protein
MPKGRLRIADLEEHGAWSIGHRVRSQESEFRIQQESNQR